MLRTWLVSIVCLVVFGFCTAFFVCKRPLPTPLYITYRGLASPGYSVCFFTSSNADISRYTWDLGDGSFSSDDAPWHKYTKAGTYRVTLFVNNDSLDKKEVMLVIKDLPVPVSSIKGRKIWKHAFHRVYDAAGVPTEQGHIMKSMTNERKDTAFSIKYIDPFRIAIGLDTLSYCNRCYHDQDDLTTLIYEKDKHNNRLLLYFYPGGDSILLYNTISYRSMDYDRDIFRAKW